MERERGKKRGRGCENNCFVFLNQRGNLQHVNRKKKLFSWKRIRNFSAMKRTRGVNKQMTILAKCFLHDVDCHPNKVKHLMIRSTTVQAIVWENELRERKQSKCEPSPNTIHERTHSVKPQVGPWRERELSRLTIQRDVADFVWASVIDHWPFDWSVRKSTIEKYFGNNLSLTDGWRENTPGTCRAPSPPLSSGGHHWRLQGDPRHLAAKTESCAASSHVGLLERIGCSRNLAV